MASPVSCETENDGEHVVSWVVLGTTPARGSSHVWRVLEERGARWKDSAGRRLLDVDVPFSVPRVCRKGDENQGIIESEVKCLSLWE